MRDLIGKQVRLRPSAAWYAPEVAGEVGLCIAQSQPENQQAQYTIEFQNVVVGAEDPYVEYPL